MPRCWLDQLPAFDPEMSKRSVFTHITPLPKTITRETAVGFLHNHSWMIEMNPLVLRHEKTTPPPNASKDEIESMVWYEITDEIQYIPGTSVKGEVSYKGGFYDLPKGLQTHVFAPGGVDIHGKWLVGGNMPGEARETVELGIEKPREGLYIREDVDLRCNVFLTNFVKRNLKKSHGALVEKLLKGAELLEETRSRSARPSSRRSSTPDSLRPQRNSLLVSAAPRLDGNEQQTQRQTSYSSRNRTPLSSQVQLSKPVCSCLGTRHHPACRYYIDIYQEPAASALAMQDADPKPQAQSAIPPATRTSSWEPTPTTSYARAKFSACHCTGGVHVEGCPSYPGLRLVRSASSTLSNDSQQTPYQISWPVELRPVNVPTEQERPRSKEGSTFQPQTLREPAGLPSDIYSPMRDEQMKPMPLMTRTPLGHAVVMELEGDMAQKYYEYRAQHVGQMDGMI